VSAEQQGDSAAVPDLYLGKYEHGRRSTYNRGCRCTECRAENASRAVALRKERTERLARGEVEINHGRYGYTNWGCRCEFCSREHSLACKEPAARWATANPGKHRESSAKNYRERQEATRQGATKHRRAWTESELELISQDDLSASELALMLGRSYAAIAGARAKLKAERKSAAPIKHGSFVGYRRGCRCDECKAARVAHDRAAKLSRKERAEEAAFTHGVSGYTRWGCRCETCSTAKSLALKTWKERSRERLAQGEIEVKHGLNGYIRGCRCEICRETKAEYSKPFVERWYSEAQSSTADRATRRFYPWTGPELELAARKDLTAREVALRLGRSYSAVVTMRGKLKSDPKTINLAGLAEGSDPGD
jgi:hypothetical protein